MFKSGRVALCPTGLWWLKPEVRLPSLLVDAHRRSYIWTHTASSSWGTATQRQWKGFNGWGELSNVASVAQQCVPAVSEGLGATGATGAGEKYTVEKVTFHSSTKTLTESRPLWVKASRDVNTSNIVLRLWGKTASGGSKHRATNGRDMFGLPVWFLFKSKAVINKK